MRSRRHRPYPCYRAVTGSSPSYGCSAHPRCAASSPARTGRWLCDPVRWWRPALHTLSGSRLWRTANVFYYVRRVAGNVRFQQIPYTARMSQRVIAFRIAVFIELIVPGRLIVLTFFSVVAAEQTVFESKIITHQQAGVGVMLNVFGVDFVVFDQVAQKRQTGT